MSQAGYTPIQLYYSTTAAAAPSAGNLANGELAVNITDGKLFYKDNGGVVRVLATAAGSAGDVVGPGSSTDNALVRFDGTTGKLVQSSVGVLSDAGALSGLTGLTSSGSITFSGLTSGRVTYAGTGGLLQDSANLTFDGTTLTANALTVSNAVTLSGGTANGVAYLNGSKVLTTGSALTFDGTLVNTVADASTALKLAGATGKVRVRPYTDSTYGVIFDSTNAAESAYLPLSLFGSNIYSAADTAVIWRVASSEQMRLTSTGLGIGTSSPGEKLTVIGNGNFSGGFVNTTGGGLGLRVDGVLMADRDQNNGITLIGGADNTLRLRTGSTTRATLDSSGNLGLGVTPSASQASGVLFLKNNGQLAYSGPISYFDTNIVYNSGADRYIANGTASRIAQIGGDFRFFNAPSGTAGNAISFTQAMTLDASGNLGVGTTSPAFAGVGTAFTINQANNSTGSIVSLQTAATNRAYLFANSSQVVLSAVTAIPLVFNTSDTERARIDSSGNLLVSKTVDTDSVAGTVITLVDAGGAGKHGKIKVTNTVGTGQYILQGLNASGGTVGGVTTTSTTTSFPTSSDYRLKENIAPMTGALAVVQKLNPVTYTWKSNGEATQGFIAHELQAVVPECVVGEKDAVDAEGKPIYQGIDTSFLVATLTAAIQELKASLDEVKLEFDAYKATHP